MKVGPRVSRQQRLYRDRGYLQAQEELYLQLLLFKPPDPAPGMTHPASTTSTTVTEKGHSGQQK